MLGPFPRGFPGAGKGRPESRWPEGGEPDWGGVKGGSLAVEGWAPQPEPVPGRQELEAPCPKQLGAAPGVCPGGRGSMPYDGTPRRGS